MTFRLRPRRILVTSSYSMVGNGHSIDGSPSLGKGQATGRVDVPVDAIATSFGYVDVALQHRSPQCVVLVNQGSHVEKKEKTVFCEGGGREDQGATCGGLYANLGTLGRGD